MKRNFIIIMCLVMSLFVWLMYQISFTEDIVRNCSEFENFKADVIDLKGAYLVINELDTISLVGDLDSLYAVFGLPDENFTGSNPYSKRKKEFFYHYDINGIGFTHNKDFYEMTYIGLTNSQFKIKLYVPSIRIEFNTDTPKKIFKKYFPGSYSCQKVVNNHHHILRTIKLITTNGNEVLLEFDVNKLICIVLN